VQEHPSIKISAAQRRCHVSGVDLSLCLARRDKRFKSERDSRRRPPLAAGSGVLPQPDRRRHSQWFSSRTSVPAGLLRE